MKFWSMVVFCALALSGCGGGGGGDGNVEVAPAKRLEFYAEAGTDRVISERGIVTLAATSVDPDQRAISFQWRIVSRPEGSLARLFGETERFPFFVADLPGTYTLGLIADNGLVRTPEDLVKVEFTPLTSQSSAETLATESLQQLIDRRGSNSTIHLREGAVYVLDGPLDFRNYHNVTLNGHGAILRRADSSRTAATLAMPYNGEGFVILDKIPPSLKVRDTVVIADGQAVGDAVMNIATAIEGNKVTLSSPLPRPFAAGATFLKSFFMVQGLPSDIVNGTNPGIILEHITFDGNARNNQLNYAWNINATIGLMGGKTSEIRYNRFIDIPNENILGHGLKVHHNVFDGLNGSAFHTSVPDITKSLNAGSEFRYNVVYNPNRLGGVFNGHSEGAISFSWGAGNLLVADNDFYSDSGHFGVLGIFAGAAENTDDNLTVLRNRAFKFEYIIKIYSPAANPITNLLITDNLFSNAGRFILAGTSRNTGIRVGCNKDANGLEILANVPVANTACL